MGDQWRPRQPDRSARIRVVDPVPETPNGVPALTKQLLGNMPPWQKFVLGLVLSIGAGGGLSMAGASKLLGVETTATADAREKRLTERLIRMETVAIETKQGARKEGLNKQQQKDVARIVKDALATVPGKPTKRKNKTVEARPSDTEEETP